MPEAENWTPGKSPLRKPAMQKQSNPPIIFQHPQYRLKVSLGEQAREKGGEELRKEWVNQLRPCWHI